MMHEDHYHQLMNGLGFELFPAKQKKHKKEDKKQNRIVGNLDIIDLRSMLRAT